MAVTDLYVVQYLIDGTRFQANPLVWKSDPSGGYQCDLNGVRVTLDHNQSMGWTGLYLRFRCDDHDAFIEEPQRTALFARKYRNEDQRRLAEAMQTLQKAITAQIHARKEQAWSLRDSIRQSLYRRVLFGQEQV